MADDYLEKWERQRKKEIEKFLSGWNWERVFLTWRNRICDYPVSLEPLFTEIWVHDPGYPVGRGILFRRPITI